jgi:hypothetical protein
LTDSLKRKPVTMTATMIARERIIIIIYGIILRAKDKRFFGIRSPVSTIVHVSDILGWNFHAMKKTYSYLPRPMYLNLTF